MWWRQQTCCRLAARPDPHVWLCRPAGGRSQSAVKASFCPAHSLSLSLPPLSLYLSLHELTLSRIAFTTNDRAMCVVFNVCNRVKVVPVNFRLPHYTCSCKTVKLRYGSSQQINLWKKCFWLGIWYHLSNYSLTRKINRKIFAHSVQSCCEVFFLFLLCECNF